MQHERGPRKPKHSSHSGTGDVQMDIHSDSSCSPPPPQMGNSQLIVPTPFSSSTMESPVDLSVNTTPNMPMFPYFPFSPFAKHHSVSPSTLSKHSRYLQNLSMDKMLGSSTLYPNMVARQQLLSLGHGGPIFPSMLEGGVIQESLQESSARLLFIIVHWLKNVPSFLSLTSKEQVLVV